MLAYVENCHVVKTVAESSYQLKELPYQTWPCLQ